jgi:hypothetical protein
MQGFCLGIASFRLGAAARAGALQFQLSPSLAKFALQPGTPCDLTLEVVAEDRPARFAGEIFVESPTGHAVGVDAEGQFLFRGRATPPAALVAVVDRALRSGTVYVSAARAAERVPFYPLDTIDLLLTIHYLAQAGGLIVHAAGVAEGGRGYLFAGPSGVGKSTMASLWSWQPGCVVLGEDTAIVTMKDGRPWLYGTPWHQDPGRCAPLGVPLAGMFLLSHGGENRVMTNGQAEGAARLLGNCLLPLYQRGAMQAILEGIDKVSGCVPIYELAFRPDGDAVDYVRKVVDQ